MTVIEQKTRRLNDVPGTEFTVEGNCITILPATPNGFTVSLEENSSYYRVSFEGWHAEFDQPTDALNIVAFGLSDSCRLKVNYRGSLAQNWTVEERDENGEWGACQWIGSNSVGLLAPPLFWLKKRTEYRYNALIKSEETI